MRYNWVDLPKPLNCFTVMNTFMINLNTGKAIQHYSTNTKIVVVQKCVTPEGTYYRTSEAAYHYLNYAFKASAFGLPDEIAPSVRSTKVKPPKLFILNSNQSADRTLKPKEKQTFGQKASLPKDGEGRCHNWFRRLFRRKK